MNRKGVAVAALLGTLGLPLYGQASEYAEISRQAEQQARWGSLGAAIAAYRQVLANPDLEASHNTARLRLARLYLDSFDYPAARSELAQLIATAPDSEEAKQARKLQRKAASKTKAHSYGGKIQFAMIHDTDTANASSGSPVSEPSFNDDDDEDLDDEDGDFDEDDDFADADFDDDLLEDVDLDEDDLDEEEGLDGGEDEEGADDDADADAGDTATPAKPKRSVHDNRRQASAALRYSYGLNERGDRWNLAGNFSQARQDDQDTLNRETIALSTGPVFLVPDWRLKVNPSVTYLQLYKDHCYDVSSTIWSLGVSHKLNRVLELGVRYNYENRDLNSENSPDVEIDTLKFSVKFKPTSHDSFDLSYSPKVEDNDQRKKDKDQGGWKVAYARKLPWDSFAGIAYTRRHTDYGNDPKGKEEDEDKYALTLGHKLTKDLLVAVSYEHKEKDSNQVGKDKNNESTSLSLSYRF
ncbi:hypothetical protein DBR00_00330 [Pseudomonas sp. HMWF032]|uniref:tetratricopeptide repeat protein n=1 Tax=Pseudomonas sp. HMWF032 TaxID=2056866 RepID=UPI000D367FDB|nr:porin family protein [Pseudomonas sp. HMWF032]PTS86891.1 hypothetical protein DBR00_00330 [Pseudomonas sp. HMWF032]PTT81638.1 hypothetical protein DBR41_16270 [Pseudomonas sp. HMWF010]